MWQRHFENITSKVLTVDEAKQRSLLVTDSSILDLARNEANALLTEKNSNTLREHFRSLPMLAEFTSNEFYKENPKEEGLRVMTSTPGRQKLVAFKNIEVNGTRPGGSNKSNPDEVRKVVDLLGSILKRDETEDLCELWKIDELCEIPTIGVVSFISDQIVALEEACLQSFSIEDIRKIDLMIGTPEKFQGNELRGKTLGVLGLGAIGRPVVSRAQAFEMRCLAYDPFVNPQTAADLGVELVSLDKLYAESDYITLHAPKTPETTNLICKRACARARERSRESLAR